MKEHEKRILEAVSKLSGVPTSEIINPPGCMKRSTARISRCRQLCLRLNIMVYKARTTHSGVFLGLSGTSSRNAAMVAQGREVVDAVFRKDLVTLYCTLKGRKETQPAA